MQWEDLNGKQAKAAKVLQQTRDSDDEQMDEDEKLVSSAPVLSKAPATASAGTALPPIEHAAADDDDNIT